MELNSKQTVQVAAGLLMVLVALQAAYTAIFMYGSGVDAPWPMLWGIEILIFTILIVFAGAAMLQTGNRQLGWFIIAFSAVLNIVQSSIGGALFGPFRAVAGQVETLAPVTGGIIVFAFIIYYAAKFLLGFAALVFGVAERKDGARVLGSLTAVAGIAAMGTNAVLIVFGRDGFLPSGVAGASGMVATVLLALCLISAARKD